jgi:FSR family fosmidomycin resistance protein-like MFS transporter
MTEYDMDLMITLVLSTAHSAQHFFSRLVPPLIPILAVKLDFPLWKLGLLISAYSLASGFGQTPVGILSDRYDRRFILPPGLGILAFSYVVFGLAPVLGASIPAFNIVGFSFTGPFLVMVVAMVIGGVGASVTHPTGYPLISANVDEERKGKALGIWGSAAKGGDAAAPVLIGVLILVIAWNEILLLFGGIGIIYAILLFVILSLNQFDTFPPESSSNETDNNDVDGVNVWQGDKRIFIYPMFVILVFFAARTIATKGVTTFVPTFIVNTYGYSFTHFGLSLNPKSFANFYFSALLLTAAVVQLIAGELTDMYDHRKILIGFLCISTVALGLLSFVALSPLLLLFVLLVVGGGLWGLNPARDALISDISPPEREGRTFGYLWTITQIIGALSPVFIGFIAAITSIQNSFKYLALVTFVSTLAIGLLFSDHIYQETEEPADRRGTEST